MRRRRRSIRVIGFFLRPLLQTIVKRRWRGLENIPDDGFVFAVNHIAHVDPLMIAHLLYDQDISPRYLAKSGLFDIPVFGAILRVTGQIPVYRNSRSAADAFSASVDAVEQGACVIVYPEATISRDPGLWPMKGKTGAARIALETGRPLLPVAQWGSHELLYPYTKRPHPLPRKTIAISVGEPLDIDDLRTQPISAATVREATERLMGAISTLLGEIREAEPPPEPYDPAAHHHDDNEGGEA